jgi:hypothetical protein
MKIKLNTKLNTKAIATVAKLNQSKKKIEWELSQVRKAIRILSR